MNFFGELKLASEQGPGLSNVFKMLLVVALMLTRSSDNCFYICLLFACNSVRNFFINIFTFVLYLNQRNWVNVSMNSHACVHHEIFDRIPTFSEKDLVSKKHCACV